MQGFLIKEIRPILVAFKFLHKTLLGGEFKYLFGFKDINACQLTKNCKENSILRSFVEFANSSFLKGAIHECPYGPGLMRVENASVPIESSISFGYVQRLPNGIYRIDLTMFNKNDDNIFTMNLTMINKWRENTLAGDEKF